MSLPRLTTGSIRACLILLFVGQGSSWGSDDNAVLLRIELLRDRGNPERALAAQELGEFGPKAKAAIPALFEALEDVPEVRASAVRALAKIGPPALHALTKALESRDADVRETAAQALRDLGPEAGPVVADLLKMLQSDSALVRKTVLSTLGGIATPATARACADRAIIDSDAEVRSLAVFQLRSMGSAAKPAVPALIGYLKAKDKTVKCSAALVLGHMGGHATSAMPTLSRLLHHSSPDVRLAAAQATLCIDASKEEAIKVLLWAMRHPETSIRQKAIVIIRVTSVRDKRIVAALITAARNDKDEILRSDSLQGLTLICLPADIIVPVLVNALTDKSARVRATAASELGLVNDPKRAIPALIRAMSDLDTDVRTMAAYSLGQFGNDKKEILSAIPALTQSLQDPEQRVRDTAMRALEKIRRMQ